MLDRATELYGGSSFSSWIGAFVGDALLPTVGGEFGHESVDVPVMPETGQSIMHATRQTVREINIK